MRDASTLSGKSCFLWGLRQTCKSTLLRKLFPESPYYDLLEASLFRRLTAAPGLIEEELLAMGHSYDHGTGIIDEVQINRQPHIGPTSRPAFMEGGSSGEPVHTCEPGLTKTTNHRSHRHPPLAGVSG